MSWVSFLPFSSLLRPSVFDLGSGTAQTDRQTDRQTTAVNALFPPPTLLELEHNKKEVYYEVYEVYDMLKCSMFSQFWSLSGA